MLVLGDVVVQINGVDCHYMSGEAVLIEVVKRLADEERAGSKANELLLQTPVGWKADLVIRRPPKRTPELYICISKRFPYPFPSCRCTHAYNDQRLSTGRVHNPCSC